MKTVLLLIALALVATSCYNDEDIIIINGNGRSSRPDNWGFVDKDGGFRNKQTPEVKKDTLRVYGQQR